MSARSLRTLLLAAACLACLAPSPGGAADEPDELVPGTIVIVKPGKLAKFVAKPAAGQTFDLPDAANDPSVEGGHLEVSDATGPGADSYALPSAGWSGLGNPAGSKGYKYRGAGSVADPCRVVLIKEKVLKAVCKGAGVTLPTPFAGDVRIVLTAGTDSKRYCAAFGGTNLKNDGTLLKRKAAPAPGACPSTVPTLVSFAPASGTFVREGDTGEPTFPGVLTVTLSGPPAVDTFVSIGSSDPGSLQADGGGVTVMAGNASAPVLLSGVLQSPGVTLTATLDATSLNATVRVLGLTEMPVLVALTPPTSTIAPLGTATLTVTLDIPAGPGGATVNLALSPPGAGTIPVSVTVPEDSISATFDYDDGGITSSVTIDATLGATLSATVNIGP